MRNNLRFNVRGHIEIASITPWTLQDFLDLCLSGVIRKKTRFECPICKGHKELMTEESSISLGNYVDDYGNSSGFNPTYRKCSHCRGTGSVSAAGINLYFGTGLPTKSESEAKVNLVMQQLKVE